MNRGEGAESARVFGMWTDLEAIFTRFFVVSGHCSKKIVKVVSKGARSVGLLRLL